VSEPPDQRQILIDAREKAQRLLDDLLRQQREMPEPVAELNEAIAAAQALLIALEDTQN
jgi:NAD(P)H-dependent FMN reductase